MSHRTNSRVYFCHKFAILFLTGMHTIDNNLIKEIKERQTRAAAAKHLRCLSLFRPLRNEKSEIT